MNCGGGWFLGGGVFDGIRKERKLQIDEVAMDGFGVDVFSIHFWTL